MGEITSIRKEAVARVLSLKSNETASADAKLGDSIAVNGVCLTVVKKNRQRTLLRPFR